MPNIESIKQNYCFMRNPRKQSVPYVETMNKMIAFLETMMENMENMNQSECHGFNKADTSAKQ